MKGLLLALALIAAVGLAVAASPALAQTAALPGAEGENPPDYVLEEDGTVIIDGDGATTCSSFAAFLEQGYFESSDTLSAQAQRVLEQCEDAGLLAAAESEELPDTGGPDLSVPLVVLGVLTMVGAARVFMVHLR